MRNRPTETAVSAGYTSIVPSPSRHQICDFSCHLRSQVLLRLVQGPGHEGISSKTKWRTDMHWHVLYCVWSTSRCISPHFGVTTGLKVPKGNNNVHWFQMVEFIAWWRLDVLHKSKKWFATAWSDTNSWVSTSSGYGTWPIHPRAVATNSWISRWVDDYKLWRIWFMVVSPISRFRIPFVVRLNLN